MRGLRRIIFIAHWLMPVLVPIWIYIAYTGLKPGWGALTAVILIPPAFLSLLVGPIICVSIRRIRSTRMVPAAYALVTLGLWLVIVVHGLTAVNQQESTPAGPSALQQLGLSRSANDVTGAVTSIAWVVLWLISLLTLRRWRGGARE